MKKSIIILVALLTLGISAAIAQPKRSEVAVRALMEENSRAGNNLNSYEFFPIVDTPAPKGYKPVYISHYGRHGSRSNWGGKAYLQDADDAEVGLAAPEGRSAHAGRRNAASGCA